MILSISIFVGLGAALALIYRFLEVCFGIIFSTAFVVTELRRFDKIPTVREYIGEFISHGSVFSPVIDEALRSVIIIIGGIAYSSASYALSLGALRLYTLAPLLLSFWFIIRLTRTDETALADLLRALYATAALPLCYLSFFLVRKSGKNCRKRRGAIDIQK